MTEEKVGKARRDPIEKASGNLEKALETISKRLLEQIKDGAFVIVLAINGNMLDSEELAAKMPKRYRGVVKSRYFDGSKKHPPEWGSSAAEFGFPFGGEELRRRVTKCLNEICN